MRPLLIAFTFAAALAGTAQAQSMMCRDGTVMTGANARAMCVAHGGLPLPRQAASSASTPGGTASPSTPQSGAALEGGPGQVWVNKGSKIYHCPGDRYYGKTKRGDYLTEAAAKAAGAHGSGGKACS